MKKRATGRVTEEESPSTPSVRLTAFTVPTIEVYSVSPDTNLTAGQQLTVSGKLLNLVSSIVFPGCEAVYSGWQVNSDGSELTVEVPAAMVDGKIDFIQNSNIVVSSANLSMKKQGNVFWMGHFELGGWAANLEVASDKDAEMFEQTVKFPRHFSQNVAIAT